MRAQRVETTAEVQLECTHCGVPMSSHQGSGQRVRYFHCGCCHRWFSSTYLEVFRADAKVRRRVEAPEGEAERFQTVKSRLERWLQGLEQEDPYRTLGVHPRDSLDQVKERYRELALRNHPDRGGSHSRMQALNEAYERILTQRRPASAR